MSGRTETRWLEHAYFTEVYQRGCGWVRTRRFDTDPSELAKPEYQANKGRT